MVERAEPLAGRVAVVTGAGRGIGRATALELARLGAAVVVNDLGVSSAGEGADAGLAETVVAEIRAADGRAVPNGDSVAEAEGARAIIEAARSAFGGLDILVNNAGLTMNQPVWEVDPATFDAIVKSHLYGAFHCTRYAAPLMMAHGFGRIVNLVSRGGITGIAGTAAYGAGKGGVFGLTNVCARDLAPHGITVNGVNPASTETRMVTEAAALLKARGGAAAQQAEKLLAVAQRPEQVAVVIAALCTEAAGTINGEIFLVEGGRIGLFQPLHVAQHVELPGGRDWSAPALAKALVALDLHPLDAPY